jgi:hypothetical protein
MLGRPGHPVFTRFAAKAEEPPPKPDQSTAAVTETTRKIAQVSRKAA